MVVLEMAWLEMVLHQLKIINYEYAYMNMDKCLCIGVCVPCSKE